MNNKQYTNSDAFYVLISETQVCWILINRVSDVLYQFFSWIILENQHHIIKVCECQNSVIRTSSSHDYTWINSDTLLGCITRWNRLLPTHNQQCFCCCCCCFILKDASRSLSLLTSDIQTAITPITSALTLCNFC